MWFSLEGELFYEKYPLTEWVCHVIIVSGLGIYLAEGLEHIVPPTYQAEYPLSPYNAWVRRCS